MAFYSTNPFLVHQRRQAPFVYGHPFSNTPSLSPSYPHSAYDDLELEEQAALAQLASIQQRRQAAEQVAQQEAAIQAQIAAQRDAAIAVYAEREKAREQAIRRALLAQHQREQAIRQVLAAQEERRAAAIDQQRRHLAAQQVARVQAVEDHRRRIAEQHAARSRAIENGERRNDCARRCAGSCQKANKAEQSGQDEWKQFQHVLESLFGLSMDGEEQKEEVAEKKVEDKAASKETPNKPVDSAPASCSRNTKPAPEQKTASPQSSREDPRVETDLGDLFSKFLHVNIEPAKEGEQSSAGSEALSARVNEFLSQFGLEFEPVSSSPETKQKKECSVKGKEVAEGEKPTRPVATASPAPAPTAQPTPNTDNAAPAVPDPSASLNKLRDISHELHLATESFTFPSQLAFAPSPSSDEVIPPLLFNKANSGYHAQAHKLLQLLLAADGVSSGGDKEVRRQRKAIVKAIESSIEKLEQRRDAVWNEVKERRERGEESDDEGSVSSWASESAHEAQHVEHAEDVDAGNKGVSQSAHAAESVEAGLVENTGKDQVQGFEVSAEESQAEGKEDKKENTKAISEEKDEFELL